MRDYENIDWLRANSRMIHYFGLGFIQVKIDETERMHFYIPGLEPIVPAEDVHDHRYNFISWIKRGSLSQILYSAVPSVLGDHEISEVSCAEGAEPRRLPGNFQLTIASSHMYAAGSSYCIGHEQLHRVIPGREGCITLLQRSSYMKEFAHVARPVGGPSVCPFGRKLPEEELWAHVDHALRKRDTK